MGEKCFSYLLLAFHQLKKAQNKTEIIGVRAEHCTFITKSFVRLSCAILWWDIKPCRKKMSTKSVTKTWCRLSINPWLRIYVNDSGLVSWHCCFSLKLCTVKMSPSSNSSFTELKIPTPPCPGCGWAISQIGVTFLSLWDRSPKRILFDKKRKEKQNKCSINELKWKEYWCSLMLLIMANLDKHLWLYSFCLRKPIFIPFLAKRLFLCISSITVLYRRSNRANGLIFSCVASQKSLC